MQRHIVDPAPPGVGRQQRDLAGLVQRDELAVVAAHHDSRPVGRRAQDAAGMNGNPGDIALAAHQGNAFLDADKGGVIAEEMHRRHRHPDRQRAHFFGDEMMEADSPGSNSFITW